MINSLTTDVDNFAQQNDDKFDDKFDSGVVGDGRWRGGIADSSL